MLFVGKIIVLLFLIRIILPKRVTSLIARVLKARYFPSGDILSATLGSNPSYSWRSIFNNVEVIRKGTRCRVGNGKQIHICDDKWLPTPTTHKVITPPPPLITS